MEKSDIKKLTNLMSVIIIIIGIIGILIYKSSHPDVSFKNYLIVGIIILIVAAITYKFSYLKEKFSNGKVDNESREKIPDPVSRDEIIRILREETFKNETFHNEVENIESVSVSNINHNVIYCFKIKLLYYESGKSYHRIVIYNANYPDRLPAMLHEPNKYEIQKQMNAMATDPKEKDVVVTTTSNPTLGIVTETKQVKNKNKEKENRSEKEAEDLE